MLPARRTPMKRALALLAIFLVLSLALLPGPAWAGGGWHHGHRGGHGGWWGWVRGGQTPPPPRVVSSPPTRWGQRCPGRSAAPASAAAPADLVAPPNSA